jgi:HPt (histidine-containing phosphotransfer) domain-containing protein
MSSDLEVINISIVEQARELMTSRFATMVKYFIEDTEMYISEIKRGIEEKSAEVVLSPSHTIKSSAKQLGAERVSKTAEEIESVCRNILDSNSDNIDSLSTLYQQLEKDFADAIPELNKFCD